MTPMEMLRQYLAQVVELRRTGIWPRPEGCRFLCAEDLLLQHGQEYRAAEHRMPRVARGCYSMAYARATRKASPWLYVEGYAVRGGKHAVPLPVSHAWVARADDPGMAYDLAWEDNAGSAYLGVAFRPAYVKHIYRRSKRQFYSVLEAWWAGHPLLTGEDPIEDVMVSPQE